MSKAPLSRATSRKPRKKRVTIADVAEKAGVTTAAVSLAVNGKRGVSEETRLRILEIARDLNWHPNRAAQALMGRATEAIGLVVSRNPRTVTKESFLSKFIGGVQIGLSQKGYSLLLQVVEDSLSETDLHKKWVHDKRVDGIIMLFAAVDDPRIGAVKELECPVLLVDGETDEANIHSMVLDEASAMRVPLEYLRSLGHSCIAFVAGDVTFRQTSQRIDAFEEFCAEQGISGRVLPGNFSPEWSRTATGTLISSEHPPTAIVYDNEALALAGISIIYSEGYTAPADFSLVSLEDSKICEVIHPALTALNREAAALGVRTAMEMLHLITHEKLERTPIRSDVLARETTGPPRPTQALPPGQKPTSGSPAG